MSEMAKALLQVERSEKQPEPSVLYALDETNKEANKTGDEAPTDNKHVIQELAPQENLSGEAQTDKKEPVEQPQNNQGVAPTDENQQPSPEDQNALQKEADYLHVNIEQLLKLYEQDGNLSDLNYTPYGSPYLLQSVPRDLGIPGFSVSVEKVYLPTLPEKILPTISVEVPSPQEICCNDPVSIIFNPVIPESGLPTKSMSALATEYTDYLNAAFHFTFQSCSDGSIAPQLIFTPDAQGVQALEDLESQSQFFRTEFLEPDFNTNPITITIINDTDCVPPISCDNPITQIDILPIYGTAYETIDENINHLHGKQFDASTLDTNLPDMAFQFDFDQLFSSFDGFITHEVWSAYFLDSLGNIYQLLPPYFSSTPTLAYFPCAFSPIVLDLNNAGFELTNSFTSSVTTMLNGKTVQTGWIGKENAFLTYDYAGEGPIHNNNYILTQNVPNAKTDFQALVALAGQNSGILDASNPIWNKLGVWQDANQNGQMDKNEYRTLAQVGIVSINLEETGSMMVQNGNIIHGVLTFKYANGSVGQAADVSLNYHDVIQTQNAIPQLANNLSGAENVSPSVATPVVAPLPIHVDPTITHTLEPVVQTTTHV